MTSLSKTWTVILFNILSAFCLLTGFHFKSGLRLGISPLRKIPNIPFGECRNECISRTRCQSLGYRRHVGLCLLYDQDSSSTGTVQDPAVTYSEKKHWLETSLGTDCNNQCPAADVCRVHEGVVSCDIEECGPPDDLGDEYTMYGNMRNVGSVVLYMCDGYDFSTGNTSPFTVRSECLQRGDWLRSQPDTVCYHNLSSIVHHHGCFLDRSDRALTGPYVNNVIMTIHVCARYCYLQRYTYFGLEYHSYCFCGSVVHYWVSSNNCTTPCHGDTNEICGGVWAINIYSYKIDFAK